MAKTDFFYKSLLPLKNEIENLKALKETKLWRFWVEVLDVCEATRHNVKLYPCELKPTPQQVPFPATIAAATLKKR